MMRWVVIPMLFSLLGFTGCEQASSPTVNDFMRIWVSSGASSAARTMDTRAPDSVRKVVQSMKLKSWDGNVTYLGRKTWTMRDTGNQYGVTVYQVAPVMDLGGTFAPVTIDVSVADDSGKVFAVEPRL